MALAAGTIWHDWSTGASTNGGGFDPTNANFASDLTTDTNTGNTSSPVVSSASYNFAAGDVGHWLFIQSGTNWIPGWYQIASVASNKATLTAGIGTSPLYGTDITRRNYHRPDGLNTVAGVATVGTPTSGVWTIDYSQNASARITYTDMVIDGTTNTIYTSAGNPVGKNIIGNVINVTSGTGFTVQRVQVVSTSGTQATVDKSLGTLGSTGGNGKLGGAAGSTTQVLVPSFGTTIAAGNKIYLKGDRTVTAGCGIGNLAGTSVAGGGPISIEGFNSYPGDLGTKPVFTTSTNNLSLFSLNGNSTYLEFLNFKMVHTAVTRGRVFVRTSGTLNIITVRYVDMDGVANLSNMDIGSGQMTVEYCYSHAATGTWYSGPSTNGTAFSMYGCEITGGTNAAGPVITASVNMNITIEDCIFDNNAGIIVNCTSSVNSSTLQIRSSLFVDNGTDVIKFAATSGSIAMELTNSVFYNNGGYGINNLDEFMNITTNMRVNSNNAYGANVSGPYTNFPMGDNEVTLTADPFIDRVGRNFGPNTAAGGGALLRNSGFPGSIPGSNTNDGHDLGLESNIPIGVKTIFRRNSCRL